MKNLKYLFGTIAVLIASLQCTTRNEEDLKEICFESEILPIFLTNCATAGCHDDVSSSQGYDFTSYKGIIKYIKPGRPEDGKIMKAILRNDERLMPPSGPLPAATITLLQEWINKGASNTRNCGTDCNTDDMSFSNDIVPIMNNFCVSCHNGPSGNAGVNLATYQGIKEAVENRGLIATINHTAGGSKNMPPGQKMSDCNIKKIEEWVAQGAANN